MTKDSTITTEYNTDGIVPQISFAPPVPPPGAKGHSLIKYLSSSEWAILPSKLEQLEEVVSQYIAGENVKIPGTKTANYSSRSVAVIPVEGTLVKRAYGLDAMSGVRTTRHIQADIQEAIDNPEISAIVLSIDSPGGTVDGTKELADFITSAKEIKPIIAYADGLMASAAYWIGSAATEVVAFSTAKVGSIGVVVGHRDFSEAEKKAGVKTTYLYQGKYKTAGNSSEPLSDESRKYIQGHVDTYYSMFVDAVAEARGIAREEVIEKVALGAVFIGEQAKELNLVDRIGGIEDAISLARELGDKRMDEKQMKAQLEEMSEKLASLAESNEALAKANEELKAEAEARAEADKAAAKREFTENLFSGLDVDDSLLATFVDLDQKAQEGIAAKMKGQQEALDKVLAEHQTPTEGASSEGTDTGAPSDGATAIEFIKKRDKIDDDEAMDKAQAEFPDLFKVE